MFSANLRLKAGNSALLLSNTFIKMKTFELVGTPRSEYGKKAAKAFRKEDLVPCNLYGNGENVTFTVTVDDVRKLIYTPDTMAVELTIGETKKMAVIKELQCLEKRILSSG